MRACAWFAVYSDVSLAAPCVPCFMAMEVWNVTVASSDSGTIDHGFQINVARVSASSLLWVLVN
jgi:hypothetical protein